MSENELNTQNEIVARNLTITVEGEAKSGKTTLLNIIKTCLERDFTFRTLFAGANIKLEEKLVENLDTSASSNKDTKVEDTNEQI